MLDITCGNLDFIFRIVAYIFKFIQWIVPLTLIVLIVIDVFKIIMKTEQKTSHDGIQVIFKRLIYAVIIFLIPLLVRLIFRAVDKGHIDSGISGVESSNWVTCFNQYF